MIISKEIRKKAKKFFKMFSLKNIILTDPAYDEITLEQLEEFVVNITSEGECDAFARELEYHVRKKHLQWPFGKCALSVVGGTPINHMMNIAYADNEIYLIEPQNIFDWNNNKIRKANLKKDIIYFIYM